MSARAGQPQDPMLRRARKTETPAYQKRDSAILADAEIIQELYGEVREMRG